MAPLESAARRFWQRIRCAVKRRRPPRAAVPPVSRQTDMKAEALRPYMDTPSFASIPFFGDEYDCSRISGLVLQHRTIDARP